MLYLYLDLLNLRPELLQHAVAINSVGDVVAEAMAQHTLAVRFPDTVALAQPAEGVAAGVRRSLRKAQLPQRALHIPPEL